MAVGDFFGMGMPGEPARLDYAIREQDELKARFETLVRLLEEKGVLTRDEGIRLLAADVEAAPEAPD